MARGELLYYNENTPVARFPGSSTVEHSAVNCMADHHKPLFWRRLATKLSPLIVPQLCPSKAERSVDLLGGKITQAQSHRHGTFALLVAKFIPGLDFATP